MKPQIYLLSSLPIIMSFEKFVCLFIDLKHHRINFLIKVKFLLKRKLLHLFVSPQISHEIVECIY
jgi:hypothetical protein